MSRTSRFARLGAVAIAVAALTVVTAAPALAFGPADITITPSTTGENPLTEIATVCPVGTVSATLTWTGTQSGAPRTYGPSPLVLDGVGESSDDYYLESFFDRDTDATIALDCLDAGNATIGADSALYHLPTTNAASSTPATLAANADLVAAGNCGTATSIVSVSTYAYTQPGSVLIAGFPVTTAYNGVGNYSVNLGTPASLGVSSGTSVLVQVLCTSTAPATHTTSVRNSTTVVTAAIAAPAAVTPALASTGFDSALPLAIGSALLAAGAVLLVVRRRRAQLR